jgi:DNA helicase-2/ATP-dependent DNA helicase PcrA
MAFPNNEQREVIMHRGRPLVVVAGPGTGKTRTLVERMIELLREDQNRKVSFITFTRTSRRDTCRKLDECLDAVEAIQSEFEFPRASTLHGYAKAVVHRGASNINRRSDFCVLVENKGEKTLVLRELISDLGLNLDTEALAKALSCLRGTGEWPSEFTPDLPQRDAILQQLDALLVFYNAFDLDGLVSAACRVLESGGLEIGPVYLQVDEYQDLNPTEQRLVQTAACHPDSEVVVVGDDAQSIYRFRHAHHQGLRELWDDPRWDRIRFSECHRLPNHINSAAASLIAGEGYLGGQTAQWLDDGRRIVAWQCTLPEYQTRVVAGEVQRLKSSAVKTGGGPLEYSDFLVLCPTGDLATNMSHRLNNDLGVPARQNAQPSISDDHWRLLLILRMLHRKDDLALRQWLTILGFSNSEIDEFRRAAMHKGSSLHNFCADLSHPAIAETFEALEVLRNLVGNPDQFRHALLEFPNLVLENDLFPELATTINEITQDIQRVGSFIYAIYEKFGLVEQESDVPEEDKVLLTTLHSAKGLEAEFVFVTWMNERYMPMPGRDEHEERRLLYVALTRAKQDVMITFHETFDSQLRRRVRARAMSPFLRQIEQYLELHQVRSADIR